MSGEVLLSPMSCERACEYLGTSEPSTADLEQIFTWVVNTSPGFTHIFAELLISGQKHRVTEEI